jgi:23S rRNA pseudouridine1911/1915/1917 synthase
MVHAIFEDMDKESLRQATVGPEEAGERVDKLLARRFAGLSRARIQALIVDGHLRIEDATVTDASRRVKAGARLALREPPPEPAKPAAQKIALDVVHEDKDVIVIDKPAGMVVHPAPGNRDRTLVNALIAHCGASLSGIGGERRPGIVHRIDKDTSGLIVAAKNDRAHAALAAAFARHDIDRVYLAILRGRPTPSEGDIEGAIGRDKWNRKRMAVLAKGGKPALTHYRVLATRPDGAASLVECRLATGRTHQIRVHMAELGHPLVGDTIYSRSRRPLPPLGVKFPRQALHAAVLGFVHPRTGKTMRFVSKIPSDFRELARGLELRIGAPYI